MKLDCPVVKVEYDDPASIQKALEEYKVETVISTVAILYSIDHELNLITAAEASPPTKRFIPSSWGIPYTPK